MPVCICCDSPVELVDVLYVSKQGTHLLWSNGEIAHINNVSQVVLEKQQKKTYIDVKKHFYVEVLIIKAHSMSYQQVAHKQEQTCNFNVPHEITLKEESSYSDK